MVKHSPEGGRPRGKYVVKYSDVTLIFVLVFDYVLVAERIAP
ncbi:hypothetical protein [Streptomyces sp. 150FB]|nr:hypothetical protein [Streptomyces sp. 150FB]